MSSETVRRQQPEVRHAEIMRVASSLFAKRSYGSVGMRAIADGVGVQMPSLYHYFKSKEELLYAICLDTTRDFVDYHLPILDGPEPVPTKLAALIRTHIVYYWDRRDVVAVTMRELHELTPEHFREVRGYQRKYQDRIAEVIGSGVWSGDLRVSRPRLAMMAFFDMLGGINNWYKEGHSLTIEEAAEGYVDLIVHQLLGARRVEAAADSADGR